MSPDDAGISGTIVLLIGSAIAVSVVVMWTVFTRGLDQMREDFKDFRVEMREELRDLRQAMQDWLKSHGDPQ